MPLWNNLFPGQQPSLPHTQQVVATPRAQSGHSSTTGMIQFIRHSTYAGSHVGWSMIVQFS